jgi:hypothetical protein
MYRAATSGATGVAKPPAGEERIVGDNRTPNPTFRRVPNRWYVVRNIQSSVPEAPATEKRRAWIVESDRLRRVDQLPADMDLETEVTPYVSHFEGDQTRADTLNAQSGVYIGAKFDDGAWFEADPSSGVQRVPLTAMNSSNFCFADNAVHNPNVFSIIDNFQYKDSQGQTQSLTKVKCDYFVAGWHSDRLDDPLLPDKSIQGTL